MLLKEPLEAADRLHLSSILESGSSSPTLPPSNTCEDNKPRDLLLSPVTDIHHHSEPVSLHHLPPQHKSQSVLTASDSSCQLNEIPAEATGPSPKATGNSTRGTSSFGSSPENGDSVRRDLRSVVQEAFTKWKFKLAFEEVIHSMVNDMKRASCRGDVDSVSLSIWKEFEHSATTTTMEQFKERIFKIAQKYYIPVVVDSGAPEPPLGGTATHQLVTPIPSEDLVGEDIDIVSNREYQPIRNPIRPAPTIKIEPVDHEQLSSTAKATLFTFHDLQSSPFISAHSPRFNHQTLEPASAHPPDGLIKSHALAATDVMNSQDAIRSHAAGFAGRALEVFSQFLDPADSATLSSDPLETISTSNQEDMDGPEEFNDAIESFNTMRETGVIKESCIGGAF